MLNNISITGRITKDIVLRQMPNGGTVTTFAIACDRDYKEQDGTRKCDFIDCTAFNKDAELLEKYCKKGSLVTVNGRLELRKWVKDGQARSSHEIRVDRVYFDFPKREEKNDFQDISTEDIPF